MARAHGRRAVIAVLQDVYDEFNQGIRIAPEAIPNMLRWAAAHWPGPAPAYLTLLGDGHWNMKGIDPEIHGTAPDYIPPYLAFVDLWLGEVPVDMRYGELDAMACRTSRLAGWQPIHSLTPIRSWTRSSTMTKRCARPTGSTVRCLLPTIAIGAGDFATLSDEIITSYLPTDLTVTRAYLPVRPATAQQIAATKKVISDTLQAGAWLVQFTGHGVPQYWASERLLTVAEVAGLNNGSRLPVVMSFNCLDGWFMDPKPSYQALAEVQQRQPGGGAIAAISPTGEGVTPDQQAFRGILMTVMFRETCARSARPSTWRNAATSLQAGARYLIETMTLFGDPAMRLPLAATS